jgi:hypothetical protein
MFHVFPDGTLTEQYRWADSGTNPQTGWAYATGGLASVITTVDHIARTGDTELYTWRTSEGRYGSQGGPKSILQILRRYADQQFHNVVTYASTTSTADAWKIIDADGESPNATIQHWVSDIAAACQANVFYKDTLVRQLCQRSAPANPSNGGYNPWGGDWGNLPGVRFMFGQMENKVSPHSNGTVSSSPAAIVPPTNLSVR